MTEHEMETLASMVAEKIEHKSCPLGMNEDAVNAARMLGNAQTQVKGDESSYILLLRLGKEADDWAVKIVRYAVLAVLVFILIMFGRMGFDNISTWGR